MHGFLTAALGFPTALFTFALVVVIGFWGLVLLGGLGVDALHGGHGVDTLHGGHAVDTLHGGPGADAPGDAVAGAGRGGLPVMATVSLMVAVAWFVSLCGSVLTTGPWARAAVLAVALVAAWAGTRVLLRPLARLFPPDRPARRHDFVGRTCVVRTGRVTGDFGQAEVSAEDGSTAVVQVRTSAAEPEPGLAAGRTALIFDYDREGEFFLVAPFDPEPVPFDR
ncbi:hypothetical protein AB0O31_08005 [Kitasatospora cineracea]|uniref:hypothetical protein n=1 Tax=Kitasatospora cineracea TaxID=88074 RepID=UPI00342E842D